MLRREYFWIPQKSLTGTHHAEIEVKDYGTIEVELDADSAPVTVTNFVKLAQDGFYDGLTFHRIIEGFYDPVAGIPMEMEPVDLMRTSRENSATMAWKIIFPIQEERFPWQEPRTRTVEALSSLLYRQTAPSWMGIMPDSDM